MTGHSVACLPQSPMQIGWAWTRAPNRHASSRWPDRLISTTSGCSNTQTDEGRAGKNWQPAGRFEPFKCSFLERDNKRLGHRPSGQANACNRNAVPASKADRRICLDRTGEVSCLCDTSRAEIWTKHPKLGIVRLELLERPRRRSSASKLNGPKASTVFDHDGDMRPWLSVDALDSLDPELAISEHKVASAYG